MSNGREYNPDWYWSFGWQCPPDYTVNGWSIWSTGCGWSAGADAIQRSTGRRERNFTSVGDAQRWCAEQRP